MHKAPFEERLEICRYASAISSWSEAKIILKQFEKVEPGKTPEDKSISHAMRLAFYVLYSRPFKQRPRFQIDEEIVPDSEIDVHNGIITLRDKMFAHSDTDFISSAGDSLNRVLIDIRDSKPLWGINTVKPIGPGLTAYANLLDALIKTAAYRRNKIWNRWVRHLRLQEGVRYSINIRKDDNDVLIVEPAEMRGYSHEIKKSP
jgi:hypothetical protein